MTKKGYKMKKIIFATGNQDKLREIREIMADVDVEIVSMKEAGIDIDIIEDGDTFEANALIKANTIMELTGDIVLADDISGLNFIQYDELPDINDLTDTIESVPIMCEKKIILLMKILFMNNIY